MKASEIRQLSMRIEAKVDIGQDEFGRRVKVHVSVPTVHVGKDPDPDDERVRQALRDLSEAFEALATKAVTNAVELEARRTVQRAKDKAERLTRAVEKTA